MWIQHTAAADPESPVGTTAIVHEEYTLHEPEDEEPELRRVTFNENGKARVPKDVGESLIEHYEDIVPSGDGDE